MTCSTPNSSSNILFLFSIFASIFMAKNNWCFFLTAFMQHHSKSLVSIIITIKILTFQWDYWHLRDDAQRRRFFLCLSGAVIISAIDLEPLGYIRWKIWTNKARGVPHLFSAVIRSGLGLKSVPTQKHRFSHSNNWNKGKKQFTA